MAEFWFLEIVARVTVWTLQSTWKQALSDLGPREALTHILICFLLERDGKEHGVRGWGDKHRL